MREWGYVTIVIDDSKPLNLPFRILQRHLIKKSFCSAVVGSFLGVSSCFQLRVSLHLLQHHASSFRLSFALADFLYLILYLPLNPYHRRYFVQHLLLVSNTTILNDPCSSVSKWKYPGKPRKLSVVRQRDSPKYQEKSSVVRLKEIPGETA